MARLAREVKTAATGGARGQSVLAGEATSGARIGPLRLR